MIRARSLRIAIATAGRFHVLDLARELDALGHDVRFYSYVPRSRARQFGLPVRCQVALLPYMAPFLLLARLARRSRLAPAIDSLIHHVLDQLVAWRLQPCDVFIGMSGIYLKAPTRARRKFGAKIVIERGSVHIALQKAILDGAKSLNARAGSVPSASFAREIQSYALADRIAVPSRHAEKSFLDRGFPPERLFRNPYGVDLTMFTPDPTVSRDPHLILFVGQWGSRKGADVLVAAMTLLAVDGYRLRHVGTVGDVPLPQVGWFESIGGIDQRRLPSEYRRARCLVLPSREDGFGMVMIQALACGCPVIGSDMTGADDLKKLVSQNGVVQVIPVESVDALVEAAQICASNRTLGSMDVSHFETTLSWAAYANRYERMLVELVCEPR